MRGILTLIIAVCGMLAQGAAAQQQVYDLLPPKGSAYVRFANALGGELTVRSDFLPAQHLGAAADQRVTAYFAVDRVADRELSLTAQAASRGGQAKLRATAGSYLTLIFTGTADGQIVTKVVADQADFNQTRARLAFYNATADCAAATVALDPDGPLVFQGVAAGVSKSRSVNPVDAQLKITCTDHPAAALALRGLEAGGMYSIWFMLPDGAPLAFLTRDTTAPWRP